MTIAINVPRSFSLSPAHIVCPTSPLFIFTLFFRECAGWGTRKKCHHNIILHDIILFFAYNDHLTMYSNKLYINRSIFSLALSPLLAPCSEYRSIFFSTLCSFFMYILWYRLKWSGVPTIQPNSSERFFLIHWHSLRGVETNSYTCNEGRSLSLSLSLL